MTEVGILSPPEADHLEIANLGASLSYDRIWVGELWGGNGAVKLAEVAEQTSDIGIGSAILNVFSRTPALLAMTAASLQDASDGRFTLGVGTSTASAVESLHGMDRTADPTRSRDN